MQITRTNVDLRIELTVEFTAEPGDPWPVGFPLLLCASAHGDDYEIRSTSIVSDQEHDYHQAFDPWLADPKHVPIPEFVTIAAAEAERLLDDIVRTERGLGL